MKEATGELNMSVVVISSVAILAAFFFTVLWPMINRNQESQINCSKAICKSGQADQEFVDCTYKDKNGNEQSVQCKNKG